MYFSKNLSFEIVLREVKIQMKLIFAKTVK